MTALRIQIRSAIAHSLHGCLLACALAACAADDLALPANPADTSDTLAARPPDPARAASLIARARSQVRAGSVVQTESRLGVPTFLWTRTSPALAARLHALTASVVAAAAPEVDAARAVVADYAPLYGLADQDVAGAVVTRVHRSQRGPVVVKLRARLGNLDIFGEELSVVMDRTLEPVALSGYLTSLATPAARSGGMTFALTPAAAAAGALGQLPGQLARAGSTDPSLLVAAPSTDGYQRFVLSAAAGIALEAPLRVKPVYFHLPAGLEAAYYVEAVARTGEPPLGLVSADGSELRTSEAYAYVVSAATGQVLFRKNLTADAGPTRRIASAIDPGGFTYRVWADPVTGTPYDTPAGNAFDPKVDAVPDGAQAPFVSPSDVSLSNLTFSMHDPWLAPGATQTIGNNVEAYLDLFSPDGFSGTAVPADPPTGDFHAVITAPGQFLHAQVPDSNGATAEGRQGAIQQLFYNINYLHDWYYDAGFTESAGNAQTDNFGRGGVAGDSIMAEAQDFSGFANANMSTPADGGRPKMQMYIFPSAANFLELQAPVGIAGKSQMGLAVSGPQSFDVTGNIVIATFSAAPACSVTNAGALAGNIAMFDFQNTDATNCSFSTRISRLTATGATAMIMVYTSAAPTIFANITGYVASFTKPITTIPWNSGQTIKAALATPATVTVRLFRAPNRDGAIDNQIVSHEFFHYVSNRLIGDGAGLISNVSSGMGEGWSDFNAMLLTVRPDDTDTPSNASFNGVYALATYATSGAPFDGSANHGYYFGIRRYPYSTDLSKNPLTFRHITNGVALPVGPPVGFGADGANNAEVHNTGEVWATMLWECYAALLRDTLGATPRLTFQDAQDRMKQYLISALMATPNAPTITEARDALLAVALSSDAADYLAFRLAFARRGGGSHAVSPDRFSTDNSGVVEDFGTGPELTLDSVGLDDSAASCDDDGVLDHGEYGRLSVTLRNTGSVALAQTTATITTASTDAWFPHGTALVFPAIAPGATATASLQVAYVATVTGHPELDFQIAYTDAAIEGPPATATVGFRTNTDDAAASSAADDVEPLTTPWVASSVAALHSGSAGWRRTAVDPLHHVWHADDPNAGSDLQLTSPVLTIDGSGQLTVAFDHTWSFEANGGNFDGGVIEMSVNGGGFIDIGGSAYNGTIADYSGDVNPLHGRAGFVGASTALTHTVLTQAVAPGSVVQIRFRAGSDITGEASGWNVDDIAFTGVVETPFATLIDDTKPCSLVATAADLQITVSDGVATATAGGTVTYAITASNLSGDNILGATVADSFPGDLSCSWTCSGAGGGVCTGAQSGNILDTVDLPVGGSVTYIASCAVALATTATSIDNTATVAPPGPVNDPDPSNNTATDSDTVSHVGSNVFGSKTVTGNFTQGGTVTYTLLLTNQGAGTQHDNTGAELVDVLPAGLSLVSAATSAGTVTTSLASNTVTWDGGIAAGGGMTITIVATITAAAGSEISNQATIHYDSAGDGGNASARLTDALPCVDL